MNVTTNTAMHAVIPTPSQKPSQAPSQTPPKSRYKKTPSQLAAEKEVYANYSYFQKMQPDWLKTNPDDHALLHRQKLVMFFESERDASTIGRRDYGLGNFSVQPVTEPYIFMGGYRECLLIEPK